MKAKLTIAMLGLFLSAKSQNVLQEKGNVGIGTTKPEAKLHLSSSSDKTNIFDASSNLLIENKSIAWQTNSTVQFKNPKGNITLGMYGENDNKNNSFRIHYNNSLQFFMNYAGNLGLGVYPLGKLHLSASSDYQDNIYDPLTNILVENKSKAKRTATAIRFQNYKGNFTAGVYGEDDDKNNSFRIHNGEKLNFIISHLGNVGIGTHVPGDWKLAVNGKIRAKEIKVETGWADFVFKKEYKLPTLKEVEQHIKEKGHLKDIPSAKEVEKNGILLGEMNAKLLQKIEELTLYILEQDKRIKSLEKLNNK